MTINTETSSFNLPIVYFRNFSNNEIKHFPITIFENLPNLVDL